MAWEISIIGDGPHTSKVGQGGRVVNEYQRLFKLRTDAGTRPTESAIAAALGIYPGSPFENDANATCYDVQIVPQITRTPHLAYHVAVKWSTAAILPENTDPETQTDPTTTRTRWGVAAALQAISIDKDRLGKLIVNAAGQGYSGGVATMRIVGEATAKRSVSATGYDKSNVMKNSGKLNSATYLGATAGTLQVVIEADEIYQGAFHWWDETYRFRYDSLGHQPKPVNAGFYFKDPTSGKLKPIRLTDLDGGGPDTSKVVEPEALYDAAAEAANPAHKKGSPVPYSDRPDGCSFLNIDHFETMDFADFGL